MAKRSVRASRTTITVKQRRDAYRAYFAYAEEICRTLKDGHPHLDFWTDPILALNASDATYDDIDRYKQYHLRNDGAARSDVVKRAAYFAKWTTKLRPIMIKRDPAIPSPPKDPGLLANEILAVSYALELVSEEIGKDVTLYSKPLWELLYDLHYREITEDALLAQFQFIVHLGRSRKPNPIVEFKLD